MAQYLTVLYCICLFSTIRSTAQTVEVNGKVVDETSGKTLAGVSIVIDQYKGTITNNKGEFHLRTEEQLIRKKGMIISYVGYEKKQVGYQPDHFFAVGLVRSADTIAAAIVYGGGRTILEKAIKRIGVNYPTTPTTQNGIMRVYNTVGDSDYFYKGDAVVQVYFPSYLDRNKPEEIRVVQNRHLLIKDPSSDYYKEPAQTRWVGGYWSIPDIVHSRSGFLNDKVLGQYRFSEKGKSMLDGRRVYVIDFESRNNTNTEGTLYIDTATYAFVGIDATLYNIRELLFVPISVSHKSVRYGQIGDKWVVRNSHEDNRHVQKITNNDYIRDYVALSFDSTDVHPFPYSDVVQRRDENVRMNKPADDASWKRYDSLFANETLAGRIDALPVPRVDTTAVGARRRGGLLKAIVHYLRNDNYYNSFFVSRFPVRVISPSKNSYHLAEYGLGIGLQFRLFDNVFLKYEGVSNFGIGGLTTSQNGFYLTDEFAVNKQHRTLRIAPVAGLSWITVANGDKAQRTSFRNWGAGITGTLEMTHRSGLLVSGMYQHPFGAADAGPLASPASISIAIGFLYKL